MVVSGNGEGKSQTSLNAELQILNKQLRVYSNEEPGYKMATSNGGRLLKSVNSFVEEGDSVRNTISLHTNQIYLGCSDIRT